MWPYQNTSVILHQQRYGGRVPVMKERDISAIRGYHALSTRQMEFRAMRGRIEELRPKDAMLNYPYISDHQESEILYWDSMQNDFDDDVRR